MNYEQALREARVQAVTSGGISTVNGKKFTSEGGWWCLGGVKVENIDEQVLPYVEVDEAFVRSLVTEEDDAE